MKFIDNQELAVSPVVGVMLMLVVTIIIAAFVSAFAGGLGGSGADTPQAKIQGSYSFSSDIFQLYHAGGDELSTQKLVIKIQQDDDDFGGYGSLFKGFHIVANKSEIMNNDGELWLDPSTGSSSAVPVWRAGETMLIKDMLLNNLGFSNDKKLSVEDVGKSLVLEVATTDGQLISKSKVMIYP